MRAASVTFFMFAACAQPAPQTVLPADPAATLTYGERGPFQVDKRSWQAQSRVTDAIAVDAYYPTDASSVRPVFLFVQGGLVSASRYGWLLQHVASRGYVAVAAHHGFELPFFEVDDPVIALESARSHVGNIDATSAVAIAGHSLGGVTAAWLFAAHAEWKGLALIASFPDGNELGQRDRPVLSISGATDRKALAPRVRDGLAKYADPKALFFVAGMNHYAWTDQATQSELAGDGPLEGDLALVRKQALKVLDAWMDATLLEDPAAAAALQQILASEGATP